MKFNRPFYVIDQKPNLDDPKSLRLKNWNNTDIEATDRFLILENYIQLDLFATNYPNTWSKSSCFEMLSQKDNESGGYTIGFCCLDIDDQRLNEKSDLYDPVLSFSGFDKRLQASWDITNAIVAEFTTAYGKLNYAPLYIWQSNKGFHIITRLPGKHIKLLGSKKLKFKEEFLRKYNLQNIAEFIDVDLLQQHQIKKPNELCKMVFGLDSDIFSGHVGTIQKVIYSFAKLLRYLNLPIKYVNGNEVKIKCPFHDEKTASMCIDLEKGLFKCFGCGASGNIYQFYAKFRGYDTKRDYKTIKSELDLIAQ